MRAHAGAESFGDTCPEALVEWRVCIEACRVYVALFSERSQDGFLILAEGA
jgi:hypothetical protein